MFSREGYQREDIRKQRRSSKEIKPPGENSSEGQNPFARIIARIVTKVVTEVTVTVVTKVAAVIVVKAIAKVIAKMLLFVVVLCLLTYLWVFW